MKILYREYEKKEYKEISVGELKIKLSQERKELGIFIIELENIKDDILYFGEIDAYDYWKSF